MQIQSGYFVFDARDYPQLALDPPPDSRKVQDFIKFSTPFAATPTVVVTIARLDVGHTTNVRIELSTDTVTDDGFEAIAMTWADTKIWSVGVSWIAYGD